MFTFENVVKDSSSRYTNILSVHICTSVLQILFFIKIMEGKRLSFMFRRSKNSLMIQILDRTQQKQVKPHHMLLIVFMLFFQHES